MDRDGAVAVVTLDRPDRHNCLDPALVIQLGTLWGEIERDEAVRCAVLTGAGRSFCSGADLRDLLPLLTGDRQPRDDWDSRVLADPEGSLDRALLRTPTLTKPVIVAVNGDALAGGLELMLGCDIRISEPTARFGLPEVTHGILPAGGGLSRLAGEVGLSAAMELVLTGQPTDAYGAARIGLVSRVAAPSQALPDALAIAHVIARHSPDAVRAAKRAMHAARGLPPAQARAIETAAQTALFASRRGGRDPDGN